MRQVTVALAACLVASTFAAGQGSDASNSTKSKKSNSEAVAVRLSEMQKAIEAQQLQIQHLVEQVQSRDSQIQELQQRNESGTKLGFARATSRRGRNFAGRAGGAEHYGDPQ